jgi:hypothetical protein
VILNNAEKLASIGSSNRFTLVNEGSASGQERAVADK